ncbi:MAG: YvcK family protein [Oscillospiraceae bacterium]|nr:YvcK family protein [Oscillospiraceae bacterium]
MSGIRIAALGGGTGLASMLRGLKQCTENITAIVTTADDGGSSGQLRQDLGIIPPGDIRNCILALANTEPTMERLLNYRFPEGTLAGQSFGNLFLAALTGVCGRFDEAIERMSEVLAVTGRVLPVSKGPTLLEALFENGARVTGESGIFAVKKEQKCRIKEVRLIPRNAKARDDALSAVAEADLVVLGPGSLYTSVIPNLLAEGLSEALEATSGFRVYVCNIMTQEGETEGYSCYDHAREILRHAKRPVFDVCLVNSAPVPDSVNALYAKEGAGVARLDRRLFAEAGIELRERPMLTIAGGQVRHHSLRLAAALIELLIEKRPRTGVDRHADETLLTWLRDATEER